MAKLVNCSETSNTLNDGNIFKPVGRLLRRKANGKIYITIGLGDIVDLTSGRVYYKQDQSSFVPLVPGTTVCLEQET